MSVKNPNDRIHSFVIASALGFSPKNMNKVIEKWYSWADVTPEWATLVIPAAFQPDNDHKFEGYSVHFSAVKFLIQYLNQTFEFCQTGEFIGRAQSFIHAIYKNRRCHVPRIWYQVR